MDNEQKKHPPRRVEAQLEVLRKIKDMSELETILITCCAPRQGYNGRTRYGVRFDLETVQNFIMQRKLEDAIFGE